MLSRNPTVLPADSQRLLVLLVLAWLFTLLLGTTVAAAEPQPTAAEKSEAAVDLPLIPKLDLGLLEIKNLEPTRNQTAKVSFEIHLSFPTGTDPQTIARLEHWQHRLREQVLVAVRGSELIDFVDPELVRLRKHILYRVNRVLQPLQAAEILLADFTYAAE